MVYFCYSKFLQAAYEKFLENNKLSNSIIAYRKIPVDPEKNKSVIHFANEVFDFLEKKDDYTVIVSDIENYFPEIDHSYLKKSWLKLIGKENFNEGEDKIFKNITKYVYIYKGEFENIVKKEGVKKPEPFRKKLAEWEDFRKILKNHKRILLRNEGGKGIPQGSSLSPVLANIYLNTFDIEIDCFVKKNGGIYKRYSDDILIACNPEDAKKIQNKLQEEIKNKGLKIKSDKDKISKKGQNFTYLGWEFHKNGNRLIKNSTISRYYYKMRKVIYAEVKKKFYEAKKRGLKYIYIDTKKLSEQLLSSKNLNFVKYINNASEKSPQVKKQIRNNKKNFMKIKREALNKYNMLLKEHNKRQKNQHKKNSKSRHSH